MNTTTKIFQYLKARWGLLLIIFLLLPIAFTSIKPSFYLLGWDNFSAYLNLFLNLPRTLFATWRDYRGVGVPSDSETVDIFRQGIEFTLSSVMPTQILESIYIILSLYIGTIGTYLLIKQLLKLANFPQTKNQPELAGFIGAFFYLFNLNTLSTFLLPMPMFVTRFAFIPILLYLWIRIISKHQIKNTYLYILTLVSLIGSTSYITSTVFFTVITVLLIVILSSDNLIKKNILLLLFFLLINSFWLFPFLNYYKNKSSTITKASTYIDVNETQLNEPSIHFSWDKILTLYPSFFYTRAIDVNNLQAVSIYPEIERLDNSSLSKITLFTFPILYILGAILILIKLRSKYLTWASFSLISFIILIRKEYPPLGFLYEFLGKVIPYFKIIFRFPDTKFYPLLALSGSICATILIVYIICSLYRNTNILKKTIFIVLTIIFFSSHFYTYKTYFNGNFIGPIMYNKIPPAYFDIAKKINTDKSYSRVLHLPIDKSSYWKSYSWGYIGSSFLTFLLNKPLIDRTFAPASLENDYIDLSVLSTMENTQSIYSVNDLETRALQFYNLLKKTGVKYIIWDETVSKVLYARGKIFWGDFHNAETKKIVDYLYRKNILSEVSNYSITLSDYLGVYSDYKIPNPKNLELLRLNPTNEIILYQVAGDYEPIKSITSGVNSSNYLSNYPKLPYLTSDINYLQNKENNFTYPFYLPASKFTLGNDNFSLQIPFRHGASAKITLGKSTSPENKQIIDLFTRLEENNISIYFYHRTFPTIQANYFSIPIGKIDFPASKVSNSQAHSIADYLSDWFVLNIDEIGNYRLAIDGLILPLPSSFTTEQKYLGSVLVDKTSFQAELLAPYDSQLIEVQNFNPTSNPNCTGDKQSGYKHSLNKSTNLILESENGTSCIANDLTGYIDEDLKHAEFGIDYDYEIRDETIDFPNDNNYGQFQKYLRQSMNEIPSANYISFCIVDTITKKCINNHQNIALNHKKTVIIPSQRTTTPFSSNILINLPTLNFQKNTLFINSLTMTKYKSIQETTIGIPPVENEINITKLTKNNNLTVEIPKILSLYSYYHNNSLDAFVPFNKPCEDPAGFRTSKKYKDMHLIYNENCQNGSLINQQFSSNNFYLWEVGYNLASGKYPKFSLKDVFNTYVDEYLSLYTGYPNIAGFKSLQQIDDPLVFPNESKKYYPNYIQSLLNQLVFQPAFTFIYPQPELADYKEKLFTVSQDPSNQGLVSVKNMNILELPTSWQYLKIESGDVNSSYNTFEVIKSVKILPSLWKVDIKPNTNQAEILNKYLLEFGQGYDNQWKIYKNSVLNTLLGVNNIKTSHLKINGWSNGWEIETSELPQNTVTTLYIFYTPEKLAILGWLITILSVLIAPTLLRRFW